MLFYLASLDIYVLDILCIECGSYFRSFQIISDCKGSSNKLDTWPRDLLAATPLVCVPLWCAEMVLVDSEQTCEESNPT